MNNNCVALIPARSGSVRVPNKNIQLLGGKPLLYWAIKSALESKVFNSVIVSTDSEEYASMSKTYGAETIVESLPTGVGDIKWVKNALKQVSCKIFSILRPTSPFRTANTIRRACDLFNESPVCDSIRAVERCSQHPEKMWIMDGLFIKPLLHKGMHNLPYQALPLVYVQNASLEIAWADVVFKKNSISGDKVKPFFTQGYEGFDINIPYDLKYAEWLVETKQVELPKINKEAYRG